MRIRPPARFLLIPALALATLLASAPAMAAWNVFVKDSFQRGSTTNGTVTGPASDSPVQTDPFSSPSTGAAYVPVGTPAFAEINGSHQLISYPGSTPNLDGVQSPANEALLNQGAECTIPGGLNAGYAYLRLRASSNGQTYYQVGFTNDSALVITKVVAGVQSVLLPHTHAAQTAFDSANVCLHFEANGSSPTTLTAWLADPASPETPLGGTTATITDSDGNLQSAGGFGILSSVVIGSWTRASTTSAAVPPTIGLLVPAVSTPTTVQFAAPAIVGTGPYTYQWSTSTCVATPTWTPVVGATTATPTLAVSSPTLVQVVVTDTGASNLTGQMVALAAPGKPGKKTCYVGDSITGYAGLQRATPDGTALASVLPTFASTALLLQAQEILGSRQLAMIGFGVPGTTSLNWHPTAAPYGSDPANLYAQLKAVLTANGFGSSDIVDYMIGMNDAGATSQSAYQAAVQATVTQLQADFPGLVIVLEQPTTSRPSMSSPTTYYTNTFVKPADLSLYGKVALPAVAAASGPTVSVGTSATYDLYFDHPDWLQADGIHPIQSPTSYYPPLLTLRFRNVANAIDNLTGSGSSAPARPRRVIGISGPAPAPRPDAPPPRRRRAA